MNKNLYLFRDGADHRDYVVAETIDAALVMWRKGRRERWIKQEGKEPTWKYMPIAIQRISISVIT